MSRLVHARRSQRGLSLIGTLVVAVLVVGSIILAMRLVPVYNEYFEVKKALVTIASSGDVQTPESIRAAFQRRADVGDVASVSAKDLVIAKDGNGYAISVEWERRVPLGGNVALLFSFTASSSGTDAGS